MKIKYNSITVSEIAGYTFRDYFFAEGLQSIFNFTYEEAAQKVQSYSTKEQMAIILSHKNVYFPSYLGNLKENIDAGPVFLEIPVKHQSLYRITSNVNTFNFYLHLFFLLPVILTLVKVIRSKQYDYSVLLFCLVIPLYYILLTSGISFWHGDRLVLPTLPLLRASTALSTSWGGTNNPVTLSSTTSFYPPIFVATTGNSQALASIIATPKLSMSDNAEKIFIILR